ncbi:MAG: 16S rRNA (adenine(1518)-N(6)/adenine(1519)-N(6))-dimethyltransferase RsmA [Myxococcota bacterium]|nr:16S rRNA (adenine(1518)-N(6)/adenine(1519)-N(6))-dimethyltransferase RsmA [Myxococcota bacterium]
MSPSPGGGETREILARRGLHLRRELGQNFLTDDRLADRLAGLAGVGPEDRVIEVGTGLGVLTRALARRARTVISFEIDSGLVAALGEEKLLPGNVELIHADALGVDLGEFLGEGEAPVRVVANLPYSAATPLLRRMLDLRHRLADWSVMLQREVAKRMVAPVGSRDYGSLAVLHHLTVDAQVQQELGPGSFFPAPDVHSSFLRVWPRHTPLLEPDELAHVERVVRAAFAQRRKTLVNCLRAGSAWAEGDRARLEGILEGVGIDPGARAEQVDPQRLLALARALA